jgi:CPA2 family monovalent cation:H+ antiporter-2
VHPNVEDSTMLPLLPELVAILSLAVVIIYLSSRIRVPAIVGLMLTGIAIGPYGMRLVTTLSAVEAISQFGVIALLFVTGLQFSLKQALRIKVTVLVGGPLQIGLTAVPLVAILSWLGLPMMESVLVSLMLANSSTAITLRLLQDRLELESAHGKAAVGISVFQDLLVIQMMLFLPFLAGKGEGNLPVLVLLKGLAIVALVGVAAYWVVPRLLHLVARVRSREIFMMAVLALGLATAMIAERLSLSLALGAFLAGLVISESDYTQAALSFVQPFRDVFTSIFFVSIGMLLDARVLLADGLFLVAGALGLVVLKAVVAAAVLLLLGGSSRTVTLAGISLSQVGEASFVPAWAALGIGLLTMETYQLFLALSILSMASTPVIYPWGESLVTAINRLPLPVWMKTGRSGRTSDKVVPVFADHIVVVGFGVCGRDVVRAAELAEVRYVVIELNAETVSREKAQGRPIIFGDATQESVLDQACVREARVLVVVVPDTQAAVRIVQVAKSIHPTVMTVVRVRYVTETDMLLRAGTDHIVVEEVEAAVEIFSYALSRYLVPRHVIEKFATEAHAADYRMFGHPSRAGAWFEDLRLSGVEIAALSVQAGSTAAGSTLAELELNRRLGVSAVAIRRGGDVRPNPGGGDRLEAGDEIYVLGTPEAIAAASMVVSELARQSDEPDMLG